MLPPLGATPPPYSKKGDISRNYKRIPTKFAVISLLNVAKRWVTLGPLLDKKILKFVASSCGNSTHIFQYTLQPYISVIFFKWISTIISVIIVLIKKWVLCEKYVEICYLLLGTPHLHIVKELIYLAKVGSDNEQRIKTWNIVSVCL